MRVNENLGGREAPPPDKSITESLTHVALTYSVYRIHVDHFRKGGLSNIIGPHSSYRRGMSLALLFFEIRLKVTTTPY